MSPSPVKPTKNSDLARMRTEYESAGIEPDQLNPDPIAQFQEWLNQAVEANLTEPNAMVLSTVDSDGQPWSRYVLLKQLDERGFVFFTNYSSFKSQHLRASAKASLSFGWLEFHRQVSVIGEVTATSEAESDEYWDRRPRGSQLGSLASAQSTEVASRSVLEDWYDDAEKQFDGKPVERPSHWGGWRLNPQVIEFWQGRENRLHDRVRYRRSSEAANADWERVRLAP